MIIYGTALLAICHLLGILLGDLPGLALGMKTNIGGVGIAMGKVAKSAVQKMS